MQGRLPLRVKAGRVVHLLAIVLLDHNIVALVHALSGLIVFDGR